MGMMESGQIEVGMKESGQIGVEMMESGKMWCSIMKMWQSHQTELCGLCLVIYSLIILIHIFLFISVEFLLKQRIVE